MRHNELDCANKHLTIFDRYYPSLHSLSHVIGLKSVRLSLLEILTSPLTVYSCDAVERISSPERLS